MLTSRPLQSLIVAGVGISSVILLSMKPSRNKIQSMAFQLREKLGSTPSIKKKISIEKAGHPDPYDLEDNVMVSEGALYSVNYYNRSKEKE